MAYRIPGIDLNPLSRNNRALVNIIIWCALIYAITAIIQIPDAGKQFMNNFKLSRDWSYFIYRPHTLFTYIFLHGGFLHLLVNMLWLFFIGVILEDLTGRKNIWRLFIGGGISGGILFLLVFNLIPFFHNLDNKPMVGASAGVTAVVIGTATFVPNYRIYLFGVFGVRLIWIAVFRIVTDFFGVLGPSNQGGFVAHLGGAIFGFLYIAHIKGIMHIPLVDEISNAFRKLKGTKKSAPVRSAKVDIHRNYSPKGKAPNQDEIDSILDKINKSGYESLSKEEKETLFRAGGD